MWASPGGPWRLSRVWEAWACLIQWGETCPFTPALLAAALTIRSACLAVISHIVPSWPLMRDLKSGASGEVITGGLSPISDA